jgi:hypothetical protein
MTAVSQPCWPYHVNNRLNNECYWASKSSSRGGLLTSRFGSYRPSAQFLTKLTYHFGMQYQIIVLKGIIYITVNTCCILPRAYWYVKKDIWALEGLGNRGLEEMAQWIRYWSVQPTKYVVFGWPDHKYWDEKDIGT